MHASLVVAVLGGFLWALWPSPVVPACHCHCEAGAAARSPIAAEGGAVGQAPLLLGLGAGRLIGAVAVLVFATQLGLAFAGPAPARQRALPAAPRGRIQYGGDL